MAPTQFKLSSPDGLTRRMSFDVQPTWPALSSKLAALYNIPVDKVAVTYIDDDGDELTLSSEEELVDYYAHWHRNGEPIRFSVLDLSSLRSRAPIQPVRSVSPLHGIPGMMLFDVDDNDWQGVRIDSEAFGPPSPRSESHHAFVEVIDSDAPTPQNRSIHAPSTQTLSDVGSDGTEIPSRIDKGKGKVLDSASAVGGASTRSIISDEQPEKLPVHAYDVSQRSDYSPLMMTPVLPPATTFPPSDITIDRELPPTPSEAPLDHGELRQSLPADGWKPLQKSPSIDPIPPAQESPKQKTETIDGDDVTEDPPLEPVGNDDATDPDLPSFTNDIANLFDAMTLAFSSHPELSEGVRNIVNKALGGDYWRFQDESSNKVFKDLLKAIRESAQRGTSQAGEGSTEQDVFKHVAESFAGLFETFGHMFKGQGVSREGQASAEVSYYASPFSHPMFGGGRRGGRRPTYPFPGHMPPHEFPPRRGRHGHRGPPRPPGPPMPPPPPVPPMGHPPYPPPFPPPFPHDGWEHPRHGPRPPPPPPHMPGHHGPLPPAPPHHGPPAPPGAWGSFPGAYDEQDADYYDDSALLYAPNYTQDMTGEDSTQAQTQAPREVMQDRKAALQAAKEYYRAEKERFRKEKRERRRLRREYEAKRREATSSANAAGETVITRIPITPLSYERNSDPLSLGPREARSNFTYAEVYSVPTPQKPAWRQMQAQAAQTRGMAAADATITKTQKDASTADD